MRRSTRLIYVLSGSAAVGVFVDKRDEKNVTDLMARLCWVNWSRLAMRTYAANDVVDLGY